MTPKTNVMRQLDARHIPYRCYEYNSVPGITGADIARILNQDPAQVFKTLVTFSNTNKYYVFMIPVDADLDLKLAAAAVVEKSISMLKQRDLLDLTGYIHGGCSPIGMKKQFATVIDASANNFNTIIYSAGRVGYQVETTVDDLVKIIPLRFANICNNASGQVSA